MEKAKKIIEKLEQGKTIYTIAKEEKINRYCISLVKQTMKIYNLKIDELKKENQKLKQEINNISERLRKKMIHIDNLEEEKNTYYYIGIITGVIGTILIIIIIYLITEKFF